jgi:hypothetical protein
MSRGNISPQAQISNKSSCLQLQTKLLIISFLSMLQNNYMYLLITSFDTYVEIFMYLLINYIITLDTYVKTLYCKKCSYK